MSIWRTLGGDRLGSGKKQMVEMHGYERSTHNLNTALRTTGSAGTLIPFLCLVALPGDTWDIDLECVINTHPTVGPLFGSYKVELSLFQTPFRLYNARLHNNETNIGRKMGEVKLPQIEFKVPANPNPLNEIENLDNIHINPSCVLKYLGLSGFGYNATAEEQARQFHITPWLMLWDIYKNYYANKQEEKGAVIHTPVEAIINTITTPIEWFDGATQYDIALYPAVGDNLVISAGNTIDINFIGAQPNPSQVYILTDELGWIQLSTLATFTLPVAGQLTGVYNGSIGNVRIRNWRYRNATDDVVLTPKVTLFDLGNIDEMRRLILQHDNTPFIVNTEAAGLEPYSFIMDGTLENQTLRQSQEGLPVKTYMSDLFNNWVNTAWMDEITNATRVDTSSGGFSIENLILQKKLYNMYMRVAVSGGTYNDWLEVNYDIEANRLVESPIYEGGLIKELIFQEVISNSESSSGQPLGTLAGRGIMGSKHKGGRVVIKAMEHSMIIGLVSLTPRIDNSQGNEFYMHFRSMEDFHVPGLDGIGFQDLITEQMAWWDTQYDAVDGWVTKSAGKQPAWVNYQTNINRTAGNFAIQTNEMFMTLNRRYEADVDSIKDLTTYIDPSKFNYIFAQTALDAQNFWIQIGAGIEVRRKMSARVMPNL